MRGIPIILVFIVAVLQARPGRAATLANGNSAETARYAAIFEALKNAETELTALQQRKLSADDTGGTGEPLGAEILAEIRKREEQPRPRQSLFRSIMRGLDRGGSPTLFSGLTDTDVRLFYQRETKIVLEAVIRARMDLVVRRIMEDWVLYRGARLRAQAILDELRPGAGRVSEIPDIWFERSLKNVYRKSAYDAEISREELAVVIAASSLRYQQTAERRKNLPALKAGELARFLPERLSVSFDAETLLERAGQTLGDTAAGCCHSGACGYCPYSFSNERERPMSGEYNDPLAVIVAKLAAHGYDFVDVNPL